MAAPAAVAQKKVARTDIRSKQGNIHIYIYMYILLTREVYNPLSVSSFFKISFSLVFPGTA